MIGAGVLGLPSAVAALGWEAGVILMVLCWVMTLYTLWYGLHPVSLVAAQLPAAFCRRCRLHMSSGQLQLAIHVIYPMHCLMPGVLCPIDLQHLACVEDLKVANACRQMTDMHHVGDKRMDRYHELGQVRLIP